MTLSQIQHDAIDTLEKRMMQFPQRECPVHHLFLPGIYIRTVTMPADTLVTSEEHRTEHAFTLMKGSLTIWTEDGPVRLTAPHMGVTKPGTRRVAYIHEEVVWSTFHPTTKTTVEEVRADIIVPRSHLEGLIQPSEQEVRKIAGKE